MPPIKKHALDQSVLYKIRGRGRLAQALSLSEAQLDKLEQALLRGINFYRVFETDLQNGKSRQIEMPTGMIKRLHDRLHVLLSRIHPPEFLHSSVKG